LLCHAGNCSRSKDCQEKVSIKCVCKTTKKSFPCNQLTPKLLQTPIECNEKCEIKKRKLVNVTVDTSDQDAKNNDKHRQSTVKSSSGQNSVKFYAAILSFFIIFISIFIYYYF
jgi:hypothetical protein